VAVSKTSDHTETMLTTATAGTVIEVTATTETDVKDATAEIEVVSA
jgi:hypothetical protein